jgi:rhodanese-related sulfurtransferase
MSHPAPDVSVQEAADAAASDSVLLLDVREDDEWQAGHAAAAAHMPMSRLDVSAVPRDRPIIAVCRSGNRSGKAAAALAQAGVDVVNMAGGMTAWAAAGLPVVDADGRPGEIA